MMHLDEHTLNEYLDDMLPASQRRQAEAHLAACGACRAALAQLQQLFAAFTEVKELPLANDLSAHVLAEISAEPASSPWIRPLLIVQLATAVIMLGILWPTIQNWLGRTGTAVADTLSTLPPIDISIGERWAAWQSIFSDVQVPGLPVELAAAQWGLLIALAFAAWLAGNRLLFVNEQ